MLDVRCAEYLAEVRAYADSLGPEFRAQLEERLSYLEHYSGDRCECLLFKDFAPNSFEFTMMSPLKPDGTRERWFNGGLICHAPNSNGAGAPEFSVTLSPQPTVHWEVHT